MYHYYEDGQFKRTSVQQPSVGSTTAKLQDNTVVAVDIYDINNQCEYVSRTGKIKKEYTRGKECIDRNREDLFNRHFRDFINKRFRRK